MDSPGSPYFSAFTIFIGLLTNRADNGYIDDILLEINLLIEVSIYQYIKQGSSNSILMYIFQLLLENFLLTQSKYFKFSRWIVGRVKLRSKCMFWFFFSLKIKLIKSVKNLRVLLDFAPTIPLYIFHFYPASGHWDKQQEHR